MAKQLIVEEFKQTNQIKYFAIVVIVEAVVVFIINFIKKYLSQVLID